MKPISMVNLLGTLVLLTFSFVVMPSAQAATVIHVKPDGSPSWLCGDTWQNACELQTALISASAGDEIWVAAGTYTPGTNREDSFQLVSGVALFGGFLGSEVTREERDWETNLTVLSGEIGVQGDNSDNSYHVVNGSGVDAAAEMNGFTIRHGNANGFADGAYSGGGMYNVAGSPTLTNLIFIDNYADDNGYTGGYGGGIFNNDSSPTMTNVVFRSNSAFVSGGGMYNYQSDPILSDVLFEGNSTVVWSGGGMYNAQSSPTLINVTFRGNSANNGGGIFNCEKSYPTLTNVYFTHNHVEGDDGNGGGMFNDDSSPSLNDVTFSDNTADKGGGMYNTNISEPILTNVTFYGNIARAGGGMYNWGGSQTLANVTFIGNFAEEIGGGMLNTFGSSPRLTDASFKGNSSQYGGGMWNTDSHILLTNVIFTGNYADGGGGMYNQFSGSILTNVSLSGNQADYGGGIVNGFRSSTDFVNTILWDNLAEVSNPQIYNDDMSSCSVVYSDIQGGCESIPGAYCLGDGNIDADPHFLRDPNSGPDDTWGTDDDDYGDLRLGYLSPAIDAGDNTAPELVEITLDLDSNPRFIDIPNVADTGNGAPPIVDMGAYEAQSPPDFIYLPFAWK